MLPWSGQISVNDVINTPRGSSSRWNKTELLPQYQILRCFAPLPPGSQQLEVHQLMLWPNMFLSPFCTSTLFFFSFVWVCSFKFWNDSFYLASYLSVYTANVNRSSSPQKTIFNPMYISFNLSKSGRLKYADCTSEKYRPICVTVAFRESSAWCHSPALERELLPKLSF